jgi:hypothetical protein
MCRTVPKNDEIVDVIILVPAAILGSIPRSIIIGRRIVPKARPTNPPRIPIKKDDIPIVIIIYIDKSVEKKPCKSCHLIIIKKHIISIDMIKAILVLLSGKFIFHWWF